jgi:tetratricopeptide (TPR) repeat protein
MKGQNNNPVVDSLQAILKNASQDSVKCRLLVAITEECEADEIFDNASKAVELADHVLKEGNFVNGASKYSVLYTKSLALNNVGVYYNIEGNYDKALEYFERSLKIREDMADKMGITESLNNIGLIYNTMGDITKALDYYGRSLKLKERIADKEGIATLLNNIAVIYYRQGDLINSLEYHKKSLKISESLGDKTSVGESLSNIAIIFQKEGKFNEALDYCNKSLKIAEEFGEKQNMAVALNNIGNLLLNQKKVDEALPYYKRSLKIKREMGDKRGIAYAFANLGLLHYTAFTVKPSGPGAKDLSLAFNYSDSALKLSKKIGFPENIKNSQRLLSDIENERHNYQSAFEHYKQYVLFRDSINNEQTRKASVKHQLKYEYEKKEAVIKEQQEKERLVAEQKSRFQNIVIASVLIGMLLVVIFAIFIFRSLKTTRRQKLLIEHKQKEILDSIHYAKRIQTALIPDEKHFERSLHRVMK